MFGGFLSHLAALFSARTLTANIRRRRGAKVEINVPVFHDAKTPKPYLEPAPDSLLNFLGVGEGTLPDLLPGVALPDHVYMDAMAFGMGNSCLQVTFQACSVEEARTLYDHLTPIAPILVCKTVLSKLVPILIARRVVAVGTHCIDTHSSRPLGRHGCPLECDFGVCR